MNFTSTNDVDAALRATDELRAMLNGFVTGACNMLALLGRRELALKDCRECLVAHEAEQAALLASAPAATPPEDPVTPLPAERVLSFASLNGSSNQSIEVTP